MATGFVSVGELRQAVDIYLGLVYPEGTPGRVLQHLKSLEGLEAAAEAPRGMFEVEQCGGKPAYAMRLGQPRYPHMKVIVEEAPTGGGFLYRADAHDSHLHAPPGSPDAEPLAALRANNKMLTEGIEAAWMGAGLPTFRGYLRAELEKRKRTTP